MLALSNVSFLNARNSKVLVVVSQIFYLAADFAYANTAILLLECYQDMGLGVSRLCDCCL